MEARSRGERLIERLIELLVWLAYLASIAGLGLRSGRSGPGLALETRASLGLLVFLGSVAFGCALCWVRRDERRWPRCLLGGVLGLVVSSLACSYAQRDTVLVCLPFLFGPAGATLGGATTLALRRDPWKSKPT